MRTNKFYIICLIIIAIFAISQQTPAQFTDSMGGGWNNPLSASASTMIWNSIWNKSIYKNVGGKEKTTSKASPNTSSASVSQSNQTPTITTAQMNQAVRFNPTGTRLMLQSMVDKLGGTPEQKQQTSKLLSVILDKYDEESTENGYPHDLALALGSFIAFNSAVYQEKTIVPDEMILQVRNLIAELAAEKGIFNGVSDRKRQETYEVLVMLGGLVYISYEDAKKRNSTEEMKIFRQLAASNIKTILGMEPDTLNFTKESLSSTNTVNNETKISNSQTITSSVNANANTIDVKSFAGQFGENEVRADQLYQNKRVRLRGVVQSIKTIDGRVSLLFETGMANDSVVCRFSEGNKNQLSGIRGNQEVITEGIVLGFNGVSVILDNCSIQ